MKILFFGTPSYATAILKSLISSDFDVVGLVCMPDRPVGRKQILTPPDTKKYLIYNDIDIPIYQPSLLKDYDELNKLDIDIMIVAAYGNILPKHILDIAPSINLHASILPKYRGASPIQSSILNNDKYTGVTAMYMEQGLDTGDMIGFSYISIDDMKSDELFDVLAHKASSLTIKILNNLNNLYPLEQFDSQSSHCAKITKKDSLVDFRDALNLSLKFRAFYPWPGIALKSGLKLKKIMLNSESSIHKAGEILEINKDFIKVGCDKGIVLIYTVAPVAKKEMNVVSYLHGQRLKIGDILC